MSSNEFSLACEYNGGKVTQTEHTTKPLTIGITMPQQHDQIDNHHHSCTHLKKKILLYLIQCCYIQQIFIFNTLVSCSHRTDDG